MAQSSCSIPAIEPEVPLDFDQVEKPFRKLRKLLKEFPRHPCPSDVHDIRTRTRQVEATASALLLDRKGSGKQLLKALTPIRKRAGKVRDMDVLTGFASTLSTENDNECLVMLLEHLGHKRFSGTRTLHKTVVRQGKNASQALKRCSAKIKRRFQKDSAADWPHDASAAALKLSAELGKWPRLTPQNVHPFRLKVKELRNVLKLSDQSRDDGLVKRLGEVKDAIGEWHDWTELAGIAEELLHDVHAPCEVRKQIQVETQRRFEKALALANRMRAQYFAQPQAGTKRRPSQPLKEEVLKASAKLAA